MCSSDLDAAELPDIDLPSCHDNADCPGSVCLPSPFGYVCAPTCFDQACPAGWTCRVVTTADAGRTQLCTYSHLQDCRPCREDAECGSVAGVFTNRCMEMGQQGGFCGSACSSGDDCLEGYRCVFALLKSGQSAWQCQHIGPCGCSAQATADQASTDCYSENVQGKCLGTRSCKPEGLTECSAQTPQREVCDGADNDCDGRTDPPDTTGCQPYFVDGDGDGYGVGSAGCLCAAAPGTARQPGDCDDANRDRNPDAVESCNGIDDDCDNGIDEPGASGCRTFWPDQDGDGYGAGDVTQCLCQAVAGFTAEVAGDCDDADKARNPDVAESCNGIDDDCDDVTDPPGSDGCVTYRQDVDRDGFGSDVTACLCQPEAPFDGVGDLADCDDAVASIHPGAPETCNGLDDDCSGAGDPEGAEGCQDLYPDADGDGHGAIGSTPRCLCAPEGIHGAPVADDCRDDDGEVYPTRLEACNGKDDDCDGVKDPEGAADCTVYYRDVDGDGFGDPVQPGRCLCATSGAYTTTDATDCDDAAKTIHPGAQETCNRRDDDCNGLTDDPDGLPGSTPLYYDADGDGWGVGQPRKLCFPAAPWTATDVGDCQPDNPDVYPGKIEACNGYDDNCDGYTDTQGSQGCTWYHADEDRDGHGGERQKCLCLPSAPYDSTGADDCCDLDARAWPGQPEYFDTPTACAASGFEPYDFDCDLASTPEFPANRGGCDTATCIPTPGWLGSTPVPACGGQGLYVTTCLKDGEICLGDDRKTQTQKCR
mgnify:FL=1